MADLLATGQRDPIALAGLVLLAWLPLCAVGLAVLWLLAWAQERLSRRRPRRPAVVLPPVAARPLAMRRYSNSGPRSGVLSTARVTLVVAVVAAGTAFLLVTNSTNLLSALARAGG
ncbi:MAG: hypothetical protein ACR2NO_02985 [Chloroflexota bacterium]